MVEDPPQLVATRPLPDRAGGVATGPRPQRAFLFVCGPSACSVTDLPESGEATIGRAPECVVVLEDDSVSRTHARLSITPHVVTATDLGSQNGTSINGQRITEPRVLVPGDLIDIGVYTIVFSAERPIAFRAVVAPSELERRLDEELERSAGYGRSFGIVVIRFTTPVRNEIEAQLARTLRAIDVAAWTGPTELAVLVPELDSGGVRSAAAAIGAVFGGARVGWAGCPDDGADEAALFAGARSAALASEPGTEAAARRQVQRLELTGRTILIAEPSMIQLYALVERLAPSDVSVLVRGETGSGKDLVAAALHQRSRRRDAPFVAINCAALPEQLIESELFGHERGAFTGAAAASPGAFEAASGGTLFLDEIGELPLTAQAKLLRVVEAREVTRLGSQKARPVDVRVVAATNRDPREEITAGRFRQDLYFRLCGGLINVPPLRDRRREIPILAEAFLDEACRRLPREPMTIAGATMLELARHDWPGNIRELRQLMDYAAAAFPDAVLEPWHVGERLGTPGEAPVGPAPERGDRPMPRFRPLHEEIEDLERERITVALAATNGVQARAAALIHMPLRTFINKLKRYGIKPR